MNIRGLQEMALEYSIPKLISATIFSVTPCPSAFPYAFASGSRCHLKKHFTDSFTAQKCYGKLF